MTIGYFDESINPGKYALVTKEHHFHEILTLARLVISNPNLAVVVKSQFTRNSTLKLYSSHRVIQEALTTGRFVDLCSGADIRNNIYPAEVALAADICIGNAVGATASLEVALSRARSVIINPHNVSPIWAPILGSQIVFPDLDSCLAEIQHLDREELNKSGIGDWSKVIYNFDPYEDEFSFKRIQNSIL